MSISQTANRKLYTGTGSQDTFAITFTVDATDEIEVYVNDVLQTSGYSVSLNSGLTGNVVFTTAPADGDSVLLIRVRDLEQTEDFEDGDVLFASTVELIADKLTRADQDLREVADRCIRFRKTSNSTDIYMPELVADKYLKVNSAGDGLTLATGTGGGSTTLAELTDVTVSGATDGQILTADGAGSFTFEDAPEGGGGGGGFTTATVAPTQVTGSKYTLVIPGSGNYYIDLNLSSIIGSFSIIDFTCSSPNADQQIIVRVDSLALFGSYITFSVYDADVANIPLWSYANVQFSDAPGFAAWMLGKDGLSYDLMWWTNNAEAGLGF